MIDTICGVGCSIIAAPVVRSPVMTLSTPVRQELGGDLGEQQRRRAASCREGFSTVVLPAAIAGAIFHTAMLSG